MKLLKKHMRAICSIAISLLIAVPVVQAACNIPDGNGGQKSVTVEITAPSNNDKFTMYAPGSTLTSLEAEGSGGNDNALTWTFTGFDLPDNTGTEVDANNPEEWPENNSFWGEKTVRLEYSGGDDGDTTDCIDDVSVNVFFDPLTFIDSKPAWFKYWDESGGCLEELSSFSYVDSIPSYPSALGFYSCTFAHIKTSILPFDCLPKNEQLLIAKKAHRSSTVTPELNIVLTGKPVHIVTCVVEHELDHKQRRNAVNQCVQSCYDSWWEELSLADKTHYTFNLTECNQVILGFWALIDEDRDAVVNIADPTNDPDSDYDDECEAERAMVGALCDKTQDWSNGGENW